jgi:aminocarboxymuconate-semialdehyde decarboxylase
MTRVPAQHAPPMPGPGEADVLRTVDVHTHFVPPQVVLDARKGSGFDGMRIERTGGAEWLTHRQGFSYPLPPVYFDVAARLRSMDERGIDHALVSISPTLFMYWVAGTEADGFCRLANDSLAALAAESGGRITAVAALPMQHPDAAAAELRRSVSELGMRGAQIGPGIEDVPLDDAAFRPVLRTAADLGVPLILHPYYVGPRPGLEDFYLTNLIGNPLATTVCAARLIFSGTLDEIESLRLVLMHGGGYLPYQIGRLDHGHRVRPESRGCRHNPSAYLSRFWFDTVTHAPVPLRFLTDLVGSDHVVYGTDFPFDMAAGPMAAQADGTGLCDEDLVLIAGRNAEQLFGLDLARLPN